MYSTSARTLGQRCNKQKYTVNDTEQSERVGLYTDHIMLLILPQLPWPLGLPVGLLFVLHTGPISTVSTVRSV